jgi:Na+-translocating ferredoxin:NAD+ oxidoreductase RnfG subunit
MKNNYIRLPLVTVIFTVICSVAIGLVNLLTYDKRLANDQSVIYAAYFEALETYTSTNGTIVFEDIDSVDADWAEKGVITVKYVVSSGNKIGYAVYSTGKGRGGQVGVIAAYLNSGDIIGLSIADISTETAGYRDRYATKETVNSILERAKAGSYDNFAKGDAISTGATLTGNGVMTAIRTAHDYVLSLK